jgi:hypothetical protein
MLIIANVDHGINKIFAIIEAVAVESPAVSGPKSEGKKASAIPIEVITRIIDNSKIAYDLNISIFSFESPPMPFQFKSEIIDSGASCPPANGCRLAEPWQEYTS